jgi:hypothetical protein
MKNLLHDRLLENDSSLRSLFWDREDEYREWLDTNPDGFVANCDKRGQVAQYPMLHKTAHKAIPSTKINNYNKLLLLGVRS